MWRVLLLDDDEGRRSAFAEDLARTGCTVYEAAQRFGKRFASLFSLPDAIDVAVIEVLTPNGTGFETIADVRESYPQAKVVLTASGCQLVLPASLERKFAATVLLRPFSIDDLCQAVDGTGIAALGCTDRCRPERVRARRTASRRDELRAEETRFPTSVGAARAGLELMRQGLGHPAPNPDVVLTAEQVAHALRVSPEYVRRITRAGKLKASATRFTKGRPCRGYLLSDIVEVLRTEANLSKCACQAVPNHRTTGGSRQTGS